MYSYDTVVRKDVGDTLNISRPHSTKLPTASQKTIDLLRSGRQDTEYHRDEGTHIRIHIFATYMKGRYTIIRRSNMAPTRTSRRIGGIVPAGPR